MDTGISKILGNQTLSLSEMAEVEGGGEDRLICGLGLENRRLVAEKAQIADELETCTKALIKLQERFRSLVCEHCGTRMRDVSVGADEVVSSGSAGPSNAIFPTSTAVASPETESFDIAAGINRSDSEALDRDSDESDLTPLSSDSEEPDYAVHNSSRYSRPSQTPRSFKSERITPARRRMATAGPANSLNVPEEDYKISVKQDSNEEIDYALGQRYGQHDVLSQIKGQSADPETIQKFVERLTDPDADSKPKPEVACLTAVSIYTRLKRATTYVAPSSLPPAILNIKVSRRFMSKKYGGNEQDTFPVIKSSRLREHGKGDFMYISLNYNPYAPQVRPGDCGLFFRSTGRLGETWETPQRVFVKKKTNAWWYMGQYKIDAVPATDCRGMECTDTPGQVSLGKQDS